VLRGRAAAQEQLREALVTAVELRWCGGEDGEQPAAAAGEDTDTDAIAAAAAAFTTQLLGASLRIISHGAPG
jgi:hypothetical protein